MQLSTCIPSCHWCICYNMLQGVFSQLVYLVTIVLGEHPLKPQNKMGCYFKTLAPVFLCCLLSGGAGSSAVWVVHLYHLDNVISYAVYSVTMLLHYFAASAGSVVLTQTHPAAPYVCRTGNITLRCQYDGVENVFVVLWSIGGQTTINPSTIPGHTALPRTTTYQEVVVDNYTNLATGYTCVITLNNGSHLQSNSYIPQLERECHQAPIIYYLIYIDGLTLHK